jgi:hypothetical protein
VAWLALRRYASNASWLGPSFSDAPIWQATLLHTGDSSLTTRALDALRAFLAARHEQTPESPPDLQALRAATAITVSVGAARDEVGLGVSNAALAFYVEGDVRALRNLLALVHEYIGFRVRHTGDFAVTTTPPLRLEVFAPSSVDIGDTATRFTAVNTVCDRGDTLPIDVFAAPPPAICDSVLLQIEWSATYDSFTGTLSGYTWPFRRLLQREGISGARDPSSEEYYRVWPRCDIDMFGGSARYDQVRDDCLYHAPMRMLLTETAPTHTRAHLFMIRVKADPSVSVRLAHASHEPYDGARLARAVQQWREQYAQQPPSAPATEAAAAVAARGAASTAGEAATETRSHAQSDGTGDAEGDSPPRRGGRGSDTQSQGITAVEAGELCTTAVSSRAPRSPSPSARAARALRPSATDGTTGDTSDVAASGGSDAARGTEGQAAEPVEQATQKWKRQRTMLQSDPIAEDAPPESEPSASQGT